MPPSASREEAVEETDGTSIDDTALVSINSDARTIRLGEKGRKSFRVLLELLHSPSGTPLVLALMETYLESKIRRRPHKQEKLLKEQQEMTEDLNLHLDSLCKEVDERLETLDTHVKMLYTQASQTEEAVKKQEALFKRKVLFIREKRKEDAFLVESSMSMGSSYWCRPTPTSTHRSTSSPEHKTVRIQSHSDFAARHPHPPTLVRIRPNNVDRQQAERIDRQHHDRIDRQEHVSIDRQEQQIIDRFPSTLYRVHLPNLDAHRLNATQNSSQTSVCLGTTKQISQQTEDATEKEHSTLAETSLVEIDHHQRGYEHVMETQATKEGVQREKRVKYRKHFIPKHLRREVNKVELDGFHKRVKRVPKDIESRETYEDIEQLFNKVCRKPKRTLKKEQDPGKFLIPCSIQNHDLPNALCDTGSAVSIMSIDTADLLGVKMEHSQYSFTFVDNSNANSAGMIRNVKVEIGGCTIPVDFHVLEIKSGKPSSLLFGRAFMATVGAVCDLKKNMMCLTNIDERVYYDPSCLTIKHTADSTREPAKPESASIDNQPSASVDKQPSESIDTKLPASVDAPHSSEHAMTEKSKSGGRTMHIKKKKRKKNIDADFLSLVPSQFQEGSLECRVRCRGSHKPFTKVRVLCDSEMKEKGELSARAFINCINKMRKRDTETCFGLSYRKRSQEDEFAQESTSSASTFNCVDHYSNQWQIFRIGTRVDDCLEYRPIRACRYRSTVHHLQRPMRDCPSVLLEDKQKGSGTFKRNMMILESFGAFGGAELHRRVRCLAMDGDLSTSFELAFQCHRSQVNQHPVAEIMFVLLKSGQSASREEAAEKRKPRRSMQHSARRSMEIPDRGPRIFYDCVKPRSNHKLPECPWTTRNPTYVISKPLLTATLSLHHFSCFRVGEKINSPSEIDWNSIDFIIAFYPIILFRL
ncbi:hypothetical protein IGI04_030713 [Brassica rapa subsp. trilocularis]|uniref:Aspartic peptidase DDI1-type domain-containing protein n=1 Tax=Brassica rapa subsp. trilocularis TaxID=1813537 RepID=A0ABQ7LSF4_BRACM|nr:hypothetical protein IGI04_030713 [Brassica rapa subsp. trilocularis]